MNDLIAGIILVIGLLYVLYLHHRYIRGRDKSDDS